MPKDWEKEVRELKMHLARKPGKYGDITHYSGEGPYKRATTDAKIAAVTAMLEKKLKKAEAHLAKKGGTRRRRRGKRSTRRR